MYVSRDPYFWKNEVCLIEEFYAETITIFFSFNNKPINQYQDVFSIVTDQSRADDPGPGPVRGVQIHPEQALPSHRPRQNLRDRQRVSFQSQILLLSGIE